MNAEQEERIRTMIMNLSQEIQTPHDCAVQDILAEMLELICGRTE